MVRKHTNLQWRFASHPRFPYWALNMKMRHQLISQASIYFHQNPDNANLTIEELQAMVGSLWTIMQHILHTLIQT